MRTTRSSRKLLLVAALAVCLGAGPGTQADGEPVTVERARFRQTIILTCELKAVRSASVSSPRVSGRRSSYTIAELADEGTRVAKGDVVLRLDDREVGQNRMKREAELVDVQAQMDTKRLEARARQADLRSKIAEAEARHEKASIDASVDPGVTSEAKLREAHHELEIARVELERQKRALETARREDQADLEILRIREETALAELEQAERDLTAFVVRASEAGIFVLEEDWSSQRKKRVGDTAYAGNAVASIQDVSEMRAECELDQADRHLMKPGLPAELRIDAHPELPFAGQVESISPFAESPGRGWWSRSQVRAFKVRVAIDQTDPELMKPGLTTRTDVVVRDEEGLVLPRQAVSIEADGAWVQKLDDGSPKRVEVEVAARNTTSVLLAGGVSEGDSVEPFE